MHYNLWQPGVLYILEKGTTYTFSCMFDITQFVISSTVYDPNAATLVRGVLQKNMRMCFKLYSWIFVISLSIPIQCDLLKIWRKKHIWLYLQICSIIYHFICSNLSQWYKSYVCIWYCLKSCRYICLLLPTI